MDIVENGFIWLIVIEVILLIVVIGIRLFFNYLENKKIKSILKFIESRADYSGIDERLKECLDLISQNKKEGDWFKCLIN